MILLYTIPVIGIFYTAITDWRRRIIPDWIWLAILSTGAF